MIFDQLGSVFVDITTLSGEIEQDERPEKLVYI